MSLITPSGDKIIHLEPQPNFPTDDALSGNAEVIGILLEKNPGIVGQSNFLQEHQRVLHSIATMSMRRGGIQMETNPETFQGFTIGFSALEFIAMLLKGRALNMDLAAKQFAELYPKNPFMEDPSIFESLRLMQTLNDKPKPILNEAVVFEDAPEALNQAGSVDTQFFSIVDADKQSSWANRYTTWPDRQPNTFTLVMKIAEGQSDRLRFAAAALLGAQTAAELQDPSIAA